jgi:hypothetical protein
VRRGSGVGLEGGGTGCVEEPRSAVNAVESDMARKKMTIGGSIWIANKFRGPSR